MPARPPSHKTIARRHVQHTRELARLAAGQPAPTKPNPPIIPQDYTAEPTKPRLFSCVFPTGISYCDTHTEEHGDYKKLAHLFFSDLRLEFRPNCPPTLRQEIIADAAKIQAKKGQAYQVSAAGQTTILGDGHPR